MIRRKFLSGSLALGVGTISVSSFATGIAAPSRLTINQAMQAKNEQAVMDLLFKGVTATPDNGVELSAPFIVTPGTGATVAVSCNDISATAIAITATNLQRPLVAYVVLHDALAAVSVRMQLKRTSPVNAYILTERGLFSSSRIIKVTNGGYGAW
jgi:predicted secreted protein